jgi:hypothetical protein
MAASKSASLSGSSKKLAETWLIEKLVIWSWEEGVELGDHESTDVLVVFAVR